MRSQKRDNPWKLCVVLLGHVTRRTVEKALWSRRQIHRLGGSFQSRKLSFINDTEVARYVLGYYIFQSDLSIRVLLISAVPLSYILRPTVLATSDIHM